MAPPSRSRPSSRLRTGGSSGAYVVGFKELAKELRAISTDDRKWAVELGRANRVVAKRAAEDARGVARAMGGPQRHFERAIVGRATASEVRLTVRDSRAYGAFWGAKQDHTGWNAGNQGQANQPQWVGNSWDVGGPGGPYALNESIANNLESYLEEMWAGIDRVVKDAFPDGQI